MSGDNETPAWISALAGNTEQPQWVNTADAAVKVAEPVPSTTLDEVTVTAKVPDNNPTASTTYQPQQPIGGDDLTLTINSVDWVGWQRVQVTRSMDRIPANFEVEVTEKFPNKPDIDIKPGDPCTVKLGGDLVLTGYIDRYEAVVNVREHSVHISGRSKSQDLVDCAAFTGGQDPSAEKYVVGPGSILSIVQSLAQPYGINVTSQSGDGPNLPTPLPINLGETPWEIIDRLLKIAQLVAYDMPDGSIMLAQAGNEQMASGFIQGVNVEQAQVQFTMDQRFRVYEGFQTTTPILSLGGGGTMPPQAIAHDEGVPRFRKRIIISEQPGPDGSFIQKRVDWEMNRRLGRSLAVTVTADSWRDTADNLWAPNHLAAVNIPAVKIPNATWVIGQVTYIKDERGRHAIVLLMPKGAFLPEPMLFPGAYPTAQGVGIGTSNPTSQTPADAPAPPAQPTMTGNYVVGGAGGAWNLGKP